MQCFLADNSEVLKDKTVTSFVTDKDMSERAVTKEFFPNAQLILCLFHVLQIFQRTINMAKMKITSAQRKRLLKLLSKLAYSENLSEYSLHYKNYKK